MFLVSIRSYPILLIPIINAKVCELMLLLHAETARANWLKFEPGHGLMDIP